jgi:hypothetical protein
MGMLSRLKMVSKSHLMPTPLISTLMALTINNPSSNMIVLRKQRDLEWALVKMIVIFQDRKFVD